MKNHRLLLLCVVLLFAGAVSASAQTVCPPEMVCISQAAANKAAENARELAATKEKVTVLEASLVEKDKIAADIRTSGAKNEADLRAALHKTEAELALKTGQLIGSEAMNVRQTAIIDVLLKHVRPKKIGLINIF